jgi:hypothetical protein
MERFISGKSRGTTHLKLNENSAVFTASCQPCGLRYPQVRPGTSDPPGANVYASERLVGMTPFRAGSDNLFPNRYWDGRLGTYDTLIFKRPGYLEAGYPVSEWNLPKEVHVKLEGR